jgi:predicted ATPase
MLTRISVDNYKCLVDFELRLGREHLFLGSNGTGKSTVFEVLSALHRLHRGEARVDELFPPATLTRWQKRLVQTFELEVLLEGSRYRYRLELSHDNEAGRGELHEEYLFVGDVPLYTATSHRLGTVHLDNGVRSNFLTDPTRSGLGSLRGLGEAQRITRFVRWLDRLCVVRLEPRQMLGRSEKEHTEPAENLANFASWYRHLAQERLNEAVVLRDTLRGVLRGFDALILKSGGEGTRLLRSLWRRNPAGSESPAVMDEYAFEELSDGQRVLIGLYALLHFLAGTGTTLCLDEPGNFLTEAELQPFLRALRAQHGLQALLTSHHPGALRLLAPEAGLSFERVAGGPVRVTPVQPPVAKEVPAAS